MAALEAAQRLLSFPYDVGPQDAADVNEVIAALEAAAQETEAWKAIEAWLDVDMCRAIRTQKTNIGKWWVVMRDKDRGNALALCVGETRLESLTKAAAWCRAKKAK